MKGKSALSPLAIRAFLQELARLKLPEPRQEYQFATPRKWAADFCWPEHKVILEVQGGVFTGGRHVRGAALLKEWEKLNHGAIRGYRFLFCAPRDLTSLATLEFVTQALRYPP